MLYEHTRPVLREAEHIAASSGKLADILPVLRRLSVDEFGSLMFSMPIPAYPMLSSCLPDMASLEVQKMWTGHTGDELLRRTTAFVRVLETSSVRYAGRPLNDFTILDFGCGYGRFLRMMLYYSDPENIHGVDAWDQSLAQSIKARIPVHLAKSDARPETLPIAGESIDLAFAFSIFTHLSPDAAKPCLDAVRKAMRPGGIFVVTFRPIDFWEKQSNLDSVTIERMKGEHARCGIAFLPHDDAYGKTTLNPEFLARREGWKLVGYDSVTLDPFQIAAILRAV